MTGDAENLVRDFERVDDLLVNGLKIIHNPAAFRFGCDAVELANFVTGGAKDRAYDLGSGTGIITLLLGGKKGIRCTGVEIQPDMADMSKRSIMLNGLESVCDVINAPMQEIGKLAAAGSATIVVCNPPYMKSKSGFGISERALSIARHEVAVTFPEVADCAAYLLSTGGAFYLVHRAERLGEVIKICSDKRLQPKILQLLTPSKLKPPHLFLLKCVKDAKPGLKVLKERLVDTWV